MSVFAQMTLVTLGLAQTVGTTALVTQHPSVAGKTKQLQALLSIRFMAQEGEALPRKAEVRLMFIVFGSVMELKKSQCSSSPSLS